VGEPDSTTNMDRLTHPLTVTRFFILASVGRDLPTSFLNGVLFCDRGEPEMMMVGGKRTSYGGQVLESVIHALRISSAKTAYGYKGFCSIFRD